MGQFEVLGKAWDDTLGIMHNALFTFTQHSFRNTPLIIDRPYIIYHILHIIRHTLSILCHIAYTITIIP
ncbi:hypothetical protein EON63_04800 [archaeon]|nr:MAG: hypothetical protein EON63_04800 [archaeon]